MGYSSDCRPVFLFQFSILLIIYPFQPLSFSILAGYFDGQMLEPAVSGGTMPVFDTLGNVHNVAGMKLAGFLFLFLVPAAAADADQHLPAALTGVMDMPVVPAAGLKGNIEDRHLRSGERSQVRYSYFLFS